MTPLIAVVALFAGGQAKNDYRLNQLRDLAKTTVKIGKHAFTCWVADNDSKRAEGMMFLTDKEVKPTEGMIFVFPNPQPLSFWMKNTLIDLDIAYIQRDGTIVSVHTMKRLRETSVPSGGPATFALEVKAGTFKRLGIKKGMKAKIDPKVKAKG